MSTFLDTDCFKHNNPVVFFVLFFVVVFPQIPKIQSEYVQTAAIVQSSEPLVKRDTLGVFSSVCETKGLKHVLVMYTSGVPAVTLP